MLGCGGGASVKPCCGTIGGFANFSFLKVYWEFSGRPADFLLCTENIQTKTTG